MFFMIQLIEFIFKSNTVKMHRWGKISITMSCNRLKYDKLQHAWTDWDQLSQSNQTRHASFREKQTTHAM